MGYRKVSQVLSAVVCVLVAAGAASPRAGDQARDEGLPGDLRGIVTLDETFLEIGAGVPGFGGLYQDSDGRIAVWLVDEQERDRAEEIVAHVLSKEERAAGVKFLRGSFAFSELSEWRDRASTVLSIPDVVFTDVDEEKNRFAIGVVTDEAQEKVSRELSRLGIPEDAVIIEKTGPIEMATTHLQDTFRPMLGGIQVAYDCNMSTCHVCTDGFIAKLGKSRGFLTNSHCSTARGERDGTIYFQPFPTGEVGREKKDTSTKSSLPGCPPAKECRLSDSAFVKRTNGTGISRGKIARPENKTGSLNLDLAKPPFKIIDRKDNSPIVGKRVNKVGRTTGWSQGRVSRVGVNTDVNGTDITILDQVWVNATIDSGDSGSPVFTIKGKASQGKVILNGILWGGNISSGGDMFVFSPLGHVEADLGNLSDVCIKSRGC